MVHIFPTFLNWGQIDVLTPQSRTVTISNESLVPADFVAQMVRFILLRLFTLLKK